MSTVRPECGEADANVPCLSYEAALFRVLQAVSKRRGLIHGHLRDRNGHACAIGCTFDDGVKVLPTTVVDEVALLCWLAERGDVHIHNAIFRYRQWGSIHKFEDDAKIDTPAELRLALMRATVKVHEGRGK